MCLRVCLVAGRAASFLSLNPVSPQVAGDWIVQDPRATVVGRVCHLKQEDSRLTEQVKQTTPSVLGKMDPPEMRSTGPP